MLIILSDLHFTDGTTLTPVHPSAFKILADDVRSALKDKGVEEIHLVLLGDIFDLVRTDYWVKSVNESERPWNGTLDPATFMNKNTDTILNHYKAVLEAILNESKHHAARSFIEEVRSIAEAAEGKIRITYVIGNHDRAFNNFDELKRMIRDAFAPIRIDFANSLSAPEYGVIARHGHEWDDICSAWNLQGDATGSDTWQDRLDPAVNKVQNMGEVVTAEFMSGFVYEIMQSGDAILKELVSQADLVRPAMYVFEWLKWKTRDRLDDAQKTILVEALVKALGGLVNSTLADKWGAKLILELKAARTMLSQLGYSGLSLAAKVMKFASDGADSMYKGAKKEFSLIHDSRIQYLVYGHTHDARHDYFSASHFEMVKMYINTGTYLPLIQASEDSGYCKAHQMSLTFFYNQNEDTDERADKGPTVNIWNGIMRKEYKAVSAVSAAPEPVAVGTH